MWFLALLANKKRNFDEGGELLSFKISNPNFLLQKSCIKTFIYFQNTIRYPFLWIYASKIFKRISNCLPKFSKWSWTPPHNWGGGAIWLFRLTLYKNSKRKYEMYPPPIIMGGIQLHLLNFGKMLSFARSAFWPVFLFYFTSLWAYGPKYITF